jgi:hypothetical protein
MTARVYAVDGNGYFSRSGPRLAEGVALLASLFRPPQDAGTVSPALPVETAAAFRQIQIASNSR